MPGTQRVAEYETRGLLRCRQYIRCGVRVVVRAGLVQPG